MRTCNYASGLRCLKRGTHAIFVACVPSTCDAAAANDVQNGAVKRTTSFTW